MRNSNLYLILLLAFISSCQKDEAETIEQKKQEVLNLVDKAIDTYITEGSKAFSYFSDKNNTEFVYDEYYVYVVQKYTPYINVAHINPSLIGVSILETVDPDTGYEIGRVIVETALASPGGGWVEEYRFTDPSTNQLRSKFSYVRIHGDYIFGSGYYTD